ncbi:MAG: hypothetical protein V3V13_10650 [Paracoccaceae bacterium]
MIAWLSRIILIFLILTLIYVVLLFANRWKMRQILKAEHAAADKPGDQRSYIAKGLQKYEASVKPKLLLSVFVVPIVVIGVLLYLAHRA